MSKRRFHTGWRLEVHGNHHQADNNQRHDSDNFDHREPELHLTEHFHGGKVKAQQQDHYRPRGDPVGKTGEPELRVGRDRDHVGDADDDPAEPVGPASEETCPGAEQIGREIDERAILQIGQQQLAHRPHHEEQHEADDGVDEDDGRPGQRDGLAGAHEQAGSDSAANGDQLDVAVGQVALQVVVTVARSRTLG
ncbi:hypothetical protein SDC9_147312 [bioreactor metagenome]|uniref:Uncharacterized protein n=1 Tax=bioreactor metagenome TaxID=1076179 RepID=A0A645EDN9_9ZZZZ